MENINNDETIKQCSNILGHQVENKPMLDTSKIQLCADISKPFSCNVVKSLTVSSTGGASTILPADTTKDFYLTTVEIGLAKDVTCDTSTGSYSISVTIGGLVVPIIKIPMLTLTAQSTVLTKSFNPPIKIDRGTSITSGTPTFAAGSLIRVSTITGFYY